MSHYVTSQIRRRIHYITTTLKRQWKLQKALEFNTDLDISRLTSACLTAVCPVKVTVRSIQAVFGTGLEHRKMLATDVGKRPLT
jgi:hypothetical protein